MATSAFKSTTKRTSIGNSTTTDDSSSSSAKRSSSSAHRRSRSLSRFSRPLPAQDVFPSEDTPRGRFVNKLRGSDFPEISLDDLAVEFFDASGESERSASRNDDVRVGRNNVRDNSGGGGGSGSGGSVRRGRSVSRQGAKGNAGDSYGGTRVVSGNINNNPRRRRSVSVVRYQISDSESDLEHSQNSTTRSTLKNNIRGYHEMPVTYRPSSTNHRPALRRSLSQKDLKYIDGYSSQSSALTDDEGRDTYSSRDGIEKTIRTVYAEKKVEHPIGDDSNNGLYDAMRKEFRHAVEEIRMELEQAMTKTKENDNCLESKNFDSLQTVSTITRNCATKLEQSEKRKQDLLAEILLEEQRGRELSKIVKELLPAPNNSVVEKPSQTRKRSTDRRRMSTRLTEEAEKYIEDFISSIEDTDISSLDGERSDTSSTLGGITKTETFQSPAASKPLPVEMDGVVLPWLQWETTSDASPQSCRSKTQPQITPKSKFWDASRESAAQDLSYHTTSSRGSWSPGVIDGSSIKFGGDKGSKYEEQGSYQSQFLLNGGTKLQLDIDKYLKPQNEEDYLLERWRQQRRINSGGLLLCNQMYF